MGDSTPSSLPSSETLSGQDLPPSIALHSGVDAHTTAEKRALSYSITIHQLFEQTMQSKQPADRIVADYFRTHKKHGSKDRRVIRETLFALFRWYGWLSQIEQTYSKQQAWFASLSLAATLESHAWQDIATAWRHFAELDKLQTLDNADAPLDLQAKCALLSQCFTEQDFSIKDLVPNWFWTQFGANEQDEHRLLTSLCSRPPIWGRLQNITKTEAVEVLKQAEITAQPSDFFADAINLGHKSINLNGLNLYNQGLLEIQDIASQVIGNICAPGADETWWDACSGAGGKTLQLRSLMLQQDKHAKGSIVASDIRRKPLEELVKRAKRAKFKQISTAAWQSDALPVATQAFDGVLVDAPCSCTGTWRRNPDMRWLDTPETVTDKPTLQLDILSRASEAVKIGGTLVYATCSICPAENQDVVNTFLKTHENFALQTIRHPFTKTSTSMLTVMPFEADSDGMFVAKMIRQG